MKMTGYLLLFLAMAAPLAASTEPVQPFESQPATEHLSGKIDDLVFGQLRKLGIQPANPCSDAVFVRRVYLDVIGTLPTAEETVQFLEDKDPE